MLALKNLFYITWSELVGVYLELFLFNFWRTWVIFVEPLVPLFCTLGNVCPEFLKPRWTPYLHTLFPARNGLLRFIFGVTPANLLMNNIAAKYFDPLTHFSIDRSQICATWHSTVCIYNMSSNYLSHSGLALYLELDYPLYLWDYSWIISVLKIIC